MLPSIFCQNFYCGHVSTRSLWIYQQPQRQPLKPTGIWHKIENDYKTFIPTPLPLFSFSDHLSSICLSICLSVHPSVCKFFHIFIFSRTIGPISTKPGTKHPWMKGIQVCSNEGSRPFPRGDNYEIEKIHWQNKKKSSSPETLSQFQPNLAQSILQMKNKSILIKFFFLFLINYMI